MLLTDDVRYMYVDTLMCLCLEVFHIATPHFHVRRAVAACMRVIFFLRHTEHSERCFSCENFRHGDTRESKGLMKESGGDSDKRVTKSFHLYTCPKRKKKTFYFYEEGRENKIICLSTPLVVFFRQLICAAL